MMGLIFLLVVGVYVLVSIGVVKSAIAHARKEGKSVKRWGWGAALVMYLIPFWDWIPTVAMHRYYCATEAGFWVYKTPEQWKKENLGVMETLVNSKGAPSRDEHFSAGHGRATTYLLNDRFHWIVRQEDVLQFLPIIRIEQEVKDVRKNEVLGRYIDFGTGNSVKDTVGPPGPWKSWLKSLHCVGGQSGDSNMWQFTRQFKGAEK